MSRKSLRWQERALKKLEDTRLLLSLRFLNFKISTRVPETCQNDGTGIFFPKKNMIANTRIQTVLLPALLPPP